MARMFGGSLCRRSRSAGRSPDLGRAAGRALGAGRRPATLPTSSLASTRWTTGRTKAAILARPAAGIPTASPAGRFSWTGEPFSLTATRVSNTCMAVASGLDTKHWQIDDHSDSACHPGHHLARRRHGLSRHAARRGSPIGSRALGLTHRDGGANRRADHRQPGEPCLLQPGRAGVGRHPGPAVAD